MMAITVLITNPHLIQEALMSAAILHLHLQAPTPIHLHLTDVMSHHTMRENTDLQTLMEESMMTEVLKLIRREQQTMGTIRLIHTWTVAAIFMELWMLADVHIM